MDASADEIKDFVQRRLQGNRKCHNPKTYALRRFKESTSIAKKDTILKSAEQKKRVDAAQLQQDRQEVPPQRPRYNHKLVCKNCGQTGHSAWDCRHRKSRAAAYRIIPYDNRNTE